MPDSVASSIQAPGFNNAISYLDDIKLQYTDKPEVYNQFVGLMNDFRSSKIDTTSAIRGICALFRDKPALIEGFNSFLPTGYNVKANMSDGTVTLTNPDGTTTTASTDSLLADIGQSTPKFDTSPASFLPPGHTVNIDHASNTVTITAPDGSTRTSSFAGIYNTALTAQAGQ